ncbi:hypothetical protein C0J26_16645 [Pseudomonas baetica]|nr:hypothetical protein C0J26_16645 [Pseudomonas baetica]
MFCLAGLRENLWERACSRMQWVSHYVCKLAQRLREQARSHRGLMVSGDYLGQKKRPEPVGASVLRLCG